jgi:hypothetical protein
MTFNSKAALERQLIDLTDEQLVDTIGVLWESIKQLEEKMKSDGQIQALEEQIKEIKHDRYLDSRKAYKARLKAARHLAQAKGIKFSLPGERDE